MTGKGHTRERPPPASILDRPKEREQEKATIVEKLAHQNIKEDVIAILPNLHEVYARKIADLINTLNSPDMKAQAADTIRRLIEKTDMVKDDHAPHGMTLVIHGDLARIMAFCEGAKHNKKLPGSYEPGSQSSVVAGARNHRELALRVSIKNVRFKRKIGLTMEPP